MTCLGYRYHMDQLHNSNKLQLTNYPLSPCHMADAKEQKHPVDVTDDGEMLYFRIAPGVIKGVARRYIPQARLQKLLSDSRRVSRTESLSSLGTMKSSSSAKPQEPSAQTFSGATPSSIQISLVPGVSLTSSISGQPSIKTTGFTEAKSQ